MDLSQHPYADGDLNAIAVLVISLTDQPRNPHLIHDLHIMGFNPTLVPAVDARTWRPPFTGHPVDTTAFLNYYGRLPSGGEVGCALSHMLCYQMAVEFGHEWTVVLEDDAVVNHRFPIILQALDLLATTTPRVLSLRTASCSVMRKDSLHKIPNNDRGDVTLGQFFAAPPWNIGYAINAAAAAQAVLHPRVTGVADWPLWAHAFQFWGIYPWPVSIYESESTLESGRTQAAAEMKTRRFTRSKIIRTYDYLEIQKIGVWTKNLGGIRPYFRYIAVPRVQLITGKFGQKRISDEPDSPRIR